MKDNKQIKYFLRKSAFGLASVSVALVLSGVNVSADEVGINQYKEALRNKVELIDDNQLDKELKGLNTVSEVDKKMAELKKKDGVHSIAIVRAIADKAVVDARTNAILRENAEPSIPEGSHSDEWEKAALEASKVDNPNGKDETGDSKKVGKHSVQGSKMDDSRMDDSKMDIMLKDSSEPSIPEGSNSKEWEEAAQVAAKEKEKGTETNKDETKDIDENDENDATSNELETKADPKEEDQEISEDTNSEEKSKISNPSETNQLDKESNAKKALEEAKEEALKKLEEVGATRLIKKIVSTASNLEALKDFMDATLPSLEEAKIESQKPKASLDDKTENKTTPLNVDVEDKSNSKEELSNGDDKKLEISKPEKTPLEDKIDVPDSKVAEDNSRKGEATKTAETMDTLSSSPAKIAEKVLNKGEKDILEKGTLSDAKAKNDGHQKIENEPKTFKQNNESKPITNEPKPMLSQMTNTAEKAKPKAVEKGLPTTGDETNSLLMATAMTILATSGGMLVYGNYKKKYH